MSLLCCWRKKSRYSDVLACTEELEELRDHKPSNASINLSTLPHVHDTLKITNQQPSLNISLPSLSLVISCQPQQSFQPPLSSSFSEHIVSSPPAAPWEALDMDWSGLEAGFLEGDEHETGYLEDGMQPVDNQVVNADSFFSLSSREPLLNHPGESFLGGHSASTDHLSPLPHSLASYRSTMLLKSAGCSSLDICSGGLELDLESHEANIEPAEANLESDEVHSKEEEAIDLDVSLNIANSSPERNNVEGGIQISGDPEKDEEISSIEVSSEVDLSNDGGSFEMSLRHFEDGTVCTGLLPMSENFSSIQEQICVVQSNVRVCLAILNK